MNEITEKIFLVVPCFNEADRLDISSFQNSSKEVFFLFVNDGSRDLTNDIIQKACDENIFLLDLPENVGKGEAVRQGILYMKTLPIFDDIVWVGYWDADLATPLSEIPNFYYYAKLFNKRVDAIWGSRIDKLPNDIKRRLYRHYLGRFFATASSVLLKVKSYDSQCGAKLFRKELIDRCFAEPFISRWIFDLEILLRLKDFNVIEYPVVQWRDVPGSKLGSPLEIFRVCRDLLLIWKRIAKPEKSKLK